MVALSPPVIEFFNAHGNALAGHIEELARHYFSSFGVQAIFQHRNVDAAQAPVITFNGERLDLERMSAYSEREMAELLRMRAAKSAGLRTILYVCTGNAIRSQIAEGLTNHLFHGEWVAFSAGTMPMGIPKETIKVMQEIGIDLSGKFSKDVGLFKDCKFDKVVILCSDAGTRCPVFPYAGETERMFFNDPMSPEFMEGGMIFGLKYEIRSLRKQMQKAIEAYLEAQA